MRVFFALVLFVGLAMSFGYSALVARVGDRDLGSYHLYDAADGYQPVEVPLKSSDAPVGVSIEMKTVGQPPLPRGNSAVLTLVVDSAGRSVLAEPLTFSASPREGSPQTQERVYRQEAGVIDTVEDASYRFTLGPGDAEGMTVSSAELMLSSRRLPHDPRVQPIGYAVSAIGFIGLVLAFRRGGRRRDAAPDPAGTRWGRGGDGDGA